MEASFASILYSHVLEPVKRVCLSLCDTIVAFSVVFPRRHSLRDPSTIEAIMLLPAHGLHQERIPDAHEMDT